MIRGTRGDVLVPPGSLLQKATGEQVHAGGAVLAKSSRAYLSIAAWVEVGAIR